MCVEANMVGTPAGVLVVVLVELAQAVALVTVALVVLLLLPHSVELEACVGLKESSTTAAKHMYTTAGKAWPISSLDRILPAWFLQAAEAVHEQNNKRLNWSPRLHSWRWRQRRGSCQPQCYRHTQHSKSTQDWINVCSLQENLCFTQLSVAGAIVTPSNNDNRGHCDRDERSNCTTHPTHLEFLT